MNIPNLHIMMNYLRGTYKVLEEEWQKSARSIGVTQAEQHVLWIVHLEKEATITKIATIGLWDVSTVMQVITRLKQKGLITLIKKSSDRRVSYAVLTDKGQEKYEESTQFSYKLYEYLENFREDSHENKTFVEELLIFHRELNKHFHGSEFIEWTEQTAKALQNRS
ncbi:MarR family transcriptional regulator [Pseudalkalibacillus salsuginis]|uniref:MarR family transcriptional regulator n=1 Tax=Pseudalkalibacillus salsuginis TaxID=2910972 RepID=UPI001CD6435F|nr:MarR family transcriptional regulator [Pseudalkalibacillus salsuginis]MCF6408361.1 MarR family transcriptional regulator [Pseudalkalibacillus salsuginis]